MDAAAPQLFSLCDLLSRPSAACATPCTGSSNESPNSMMENPLLHGSHMSASGGGAAFVAESTAPSISTTTRLNFHPFSPSLDEGSTTISSPAGTAASPRRPGLSKQASFGGGKERHLLFVSMCVCVCVFLCCCICLHLYVNVECNRGVCLSL